MSIEREYETVRQPEPEGGFSVLVPGYPASPPKGETIEQATEMAKEAIEAYLEVMPDENLLTPTVLRRSVTVHAGVTQARRSAASRSCKPAIGR